MSKVKAKKSPFSNVSHIGMVVRDIDKAIAYYQSLGIGPFESFTGFNFKVMEARGKPITFDKIPHKISTAKMGPITLELIQPIKGEFIWTEFLRAKGEGINHFGFLVDDIDKAEAEMVKKGLKIVFRFRFTNGGGATYFDTTESGGLMFELLQHPANSQPF